MDAWFNPKLAPDEAYIFSHLLSFKIPDRLQASKDQDRITRSSPGGKNQHESMVKSTNTPSKHARVQNTSDPHGYSVEHMAGKRASKAAAKVLTASTERVVSAYLRDRCPGVEVGRHRDLGSERRRRDEWRRWARREQQAVLVGARCTDEKDWSGWQLGSCGTSSGRARRRRMGTEGRTDGRRAAYHGGRRPRRLAKILSVLAPRGTMSGWTLFTIRKKAILFQAPSIAK
jgi:hypothetical protein